MRNFKNKNIKALCDSIVRWKPIFDNAEPNSSTKKLALNTLVRHRIELIQEIQEQGDKCYDD